MKKIRYAFICIIVVISCIKQEEVRTSDFFEIISEVSQLSSEGGSLDVTVNTDCDELEVIMASADSWVSFMETKLLPDAKSLSFNYAVNPTMSVRREVARVVSGHKVLGEIVFVQEASLPCIFDFPEIGILQSSGGLLEIPVNTDYPEFEIVVDADWLFYVETKGKSDVESKVLYFSYLQNRTKEEREAEVKIIYEGREVVSFIVRQEGYSGLVLEKVYAKYSEGDFSWCSFIPGISNRSMASDGKYIYLNSSEQVAKIYALDIESLFDGISEPKYKELSTINMSGGTHAVSVLECIPDRGSSNILVASNLAVDASQNLNIYAYVNGVDSDPVLFHAYRWDVCAGALDWRRYGDRFTVTGDWQNGTLWFPSQSGTKVMAFHIEKGKTDAEKAEYCWFDTFAGGLAEATVCPVTKDVMITTAAYAQFWSKSPDGLMHPGGGWPKWSAEKTYERLIGAMSFKFFTCEGVRYIAYVQLKDNRHCDLVVLEDKGSLDTSLEGAELYRIPLYEGEQSSCAAANSYGDCSIVQINGKQHIIAMMQGGGLSIFEIK